MKKFALFSLFILILIVATGLYAHQQLQNFIHQPVNVQPKQLLTIERGTTGKKLANLLEQEEIIDNAKLLPYVLRIYPSLNKIKAGSYDLTHLETMQDLLNLINSGKEMQLSLRLIEGETAKTILAKIKDAPYLVHNLPEDQNEILKQLAIDSTNLEGWIYPDTYYYSPNSTDSELLKRAVEKMKITLDKAWQQRDQDLPLDTPYQMLILASIVEKETAKASERGKVASVFINRLNLKMKLQTDPTVIYGMGESYKGNIRKTDLTTATPYNTYIIDGLPPTPIAMPSEGALMAVANPEKTDFLFFVADGSGGHKFSRTLKEHNQAVQEYLRWYRQQKNGK